MKAIIKLYLRGFMILLLLFTALLLLIRIQPRDDHELHQLLLPDGCPAPCFMGIRPGLTTPDEAIKLLADSQWIDIDPAKLNSRTIANAMLFQWTGKQSPLIDSLAPLSVTFQNTTPKTVAQISFQLQSSITLGDLYLTLGKPSSYTWPTVLAPNTGSARYIMLVYQQYDTLLMNLLTISECPVRLSQLVREPVSSLEYEPAPRTGFGTSTLKEILNYPSCG